MSGLCPRKNHPRSSGLRGTSTCLLALGRHGCRISSKLCIGGHLSHYAKMRLGRKRRKRKDAENRDLLSGAGLAPEHQCDITGLTNPGCAMTKSPRRPSRGTIWLFVQSGATSEGSATEKSTSDPMSLN